MAEIAEELLDDEGKEKILDKVKEIFETNKIPFTTQGLCAFYEGVCLGMAARADDEDGQLPFVLVAGLKLIINERKKNLASKADDAMRENLH